MGWMFARFVAVSVVVLSAWMLLINLVDVEYEGWVLVWILASGLVGAASGILYLLSVDGPVRFRTPRYRLWGWGGMLAAVLLPTSLTLMLVPMVLVLIPTLFKLSGGGDEDTEEAITSA